MNYLDRKKIANKFAHQCTQLPTRLACDKSKRHLKRQFHRLPLTGTPSFTPAVKKGEIRLAKSSTTIGPDGMSILYLKKLVYVAINYLTNIFNLSISIEQIPEIWHKAIIIPIPKPDIDDKIGKIRQQWISSSTPSSFKSSVKRKKQNLQSFIVASFNSQSVKGNDMARKREISTFIKDNGVDLFFVQKHGLVLKVTKRNC